MVRARSALGSEFLGRVLQASRLTRPASFTNWSIYGRKYLVSKIPAQSLSHILYAFADVRDDGEVFLTDSWADVEVCVCVVRAIATS